MKSCGCVLPSLRWNQVVFWNAFLNSFLEFLSLHCVTGENGFCLGVLGFFCYIEVVELCNGISK